MFGKHKLTIPLIFSALDFKIPNKLIFNQEDMSVSVMGNCVCHWRLPCVLGRWVGGIRVRRYTYTYTFPSNVPALLDHNVHSSNSGINYNISSRITTSTNKQKMDIVRGEGPHDMI